MRSGRTEVQGNTWRRALRYAGGAAAFGALMLVSARCADLTAPTQVGSVVIQYKGPPAKDPVTGDVTIFVGDTVAPIFEVMIGSIVQPKARYVFSLDGDTVTVLKSLSGGESLVARPR